MRTMSITNLINQYKEGDLSTEELKKQLHQVYISQKQKSELSSGQKGLWMLHKLNPDSTAYHLPICFTVHKKMDVQILRRAFSYLVEQYPIVKVIMEEDNGVPYQVISSDWKLFLEEVTIEEASKEQLLTKIKDKAKEPFDLNKGPLMKVYVYQEKEKSTVMILVHHIIFDGTSIEIFLDSFLRFYYKLEQKEQVSIEKQTASFFNYVDWEKQMINGERGKKHLEYWKRKLSGNLPVLELPIDYKKEAGMLQHGRTEKIEISRKITDEVLQYVRKQKIVLPAFFLGVWKLLLYQYSGQNDIITGMVYRGRPEERFETTIGYFVNMIPIRFKIEKKHTIPEFIRQLQITMLDGMEHGEYPFPNIVRELKIPRDSSINPIFQTGYYYQNYDLAENEKSRIYKEAYPIEMVEDIQQEGEYDLTLEVQEGKKGYLICFKYNENIFKQTTIKRLARKYIWLVKQFILSEIITVEDIPMLSDEEEKIVLYDWNATKKDYPREKCVYELFMEQAKRTPDAEALVMDKKVMTYKELDDRSTKLAIYLQYLGVEKNTLVGISVQRSFDMLIGLLGILKAGGAYIPLDPLYPRERLKYMVDNSKIQIVISHSCIGKKLGELFENGLRVVNLDEQWKEISERSEEIAILKKISGSDDLAYVLYTSGSTGAPKGVMIPHQALTNFLIQMGEKPGLTQNDRLLAVTTFCFDIAGLELYLPLIKGATCYLINDEKQKNMEKLKEEIEQICPTIMQATPATWNALYKVGFQNKEKMKILCGGEALSEKLKKLFMDSDSEVWNMFGPTETTIWSTMKKVTKEEPVTIGKPIANTQLYVLNRDRKPVSIGVPGELYIGGDGLAKGYLYNEDITRERFIQNPFDKSTRLYRTGDIVKWLDTGEVEYLGRADHQVKIRGYRIEVNEIENRMNLYPDIQESVVIAGGEEGKQLQAFYLKKNQINKKQLDIKELRSYLAKWLPSYMIPSIFVELSQIPLTPNGKVNRLALKDYKVEKKTEKRLSEEEKSKINIEQIEEVITNIWQECIGHGDFAVNDGFFMVGGDSIMAVTVVERINKQLGTDITVTKLFEHSTINGLSRYIVGIMQNNHNTRNIQLQKEIEIENPDVKDIPEYYKDSVAIIGVSLNVPEAESIEQFWDNLIGMKECSRFLSKKEQIMLEVPTNVMENPDYVPVQFGIEGREFFDPGFFKISPKDAELMNPQLRQLLQASWKAVEDAGYISTEIPNTAVFISASNNEYLSENEDKKVSIMEDSSDYVKWIYNQCGTMPTLISYKMGFKGPSYFVHSNCSSGLVGMYQAYQSICTGRTDYALVGASTLHSLPDAGYIHVSGLNSSSDGHVKAFDALADGMVSGEGTAVLLLKNAKMAVESGDHIYGILRGIEITNDGTDKVGFYAPSVIGQTEAIERTLKSTGVHPETISYVEAHGTGTKLGDPIEFAGLCNAYRKYTLKTGFCGIGSVKTNIGHLDTVSGIVGCIKILLSLTNEMLPASLNFKEANEEIDFDHSPFYIVNRTKKLKAQDKPYRAALSSFGIGGTNVHAIFEQFKQKEILDTKCEGEYLVPLSAQSEERLKVYARHLLSYLETINNLNEKQKSMITIQNIAYTLLTGRNAMKQRVIFLVKSVKELKEGLSQFIKGEENIESCYKKIKKEYDSQGAKTENSTIEQWLQEQNKEELAKIWVNGAQIDWNLMYSKEAHVYKIKLPTYPFLKERYWIEKEQSSARKEVSINRTHILIDENNSSFREQKYIKNLGGTEFYLEDHIINRKKVLPGVIHIEMGRTACELAMEKRVCRMKNIIWSRPVLVEKPKQIEIVLFKKEYGVSYEIRSMEDGQTHVHSQGIAEFDNPSEIDDEVFDLEACKRVCGRCISHQEFYRATNHSVYDYGITFQPVQEMFFGDQEVLSKIEVPEIRLGEFEQFTLHPSLLEGCLQTVVGLMSRKSSEAFLPFAIEEIEIIHPLTKSGYVYATYADSNTGDKNNLKFHLWLLDTNGSVLLKMKNYSIRSIQENKEAVEDQKKAIQNIYFLKQWKKEEADFGKKSISGTTLVFEQRSTIYKKLKDKNMIQVKYGNLFRYVNNYTFEIDGKEATDYIRLLQILKERGQTPERIIYHMQQENEFFDVAVQHSILGMFYLIRALLQECKNKNIKLLVMQDDLGNIQSRLYEALGGFVRTVNQENKKYFCKVIQLRTDKIYLDEVIHYEFEVEDGEEIRYTDAGRFVSKMVETNFSKEIIGRQSPFRHKGVYLITGGLGKLGTFLATYLAENYQAKLVLLSRSKHKEQEEKLAMEIRSIGGEVQFINVDTSKKEQLEKAVKLALHRYEQIHGVFHCAGIVKDNRIEKKTTEEILAVISGKVMGAIYLDEILQNEPLDFYMLFSSISSLGNAGQSDYAYANSFLNSFSEYREILRQKGLRYGKSLSISWPFWKEGGMTMRKTTMKLLQTVSGMLPLPTEEGIRALEIMLLQEHCHVILQYGEAEKIVEKINM